MVSYDQELQSGFSISLNCIIPMHAGHLLFVSLLLSIFDMSSMSAHCLFHFCFCSSYDHKPRWLLPVPLELCSL